MLLRCSTAGWGTLGSPGSSSSTPAAWDGGKGHVLQRVHPWRRLQPEARTLKPVFVADRVTWELPSSTRGCLPAKGTGRAARGRHWRVIKAERFHHGHI